MSHIKLNNNKNVKKAWQQFVAGASACKAAADGLEPTAPAGARRLRSELGLNQLQQEWRRLRVMEDEGDQIDHLGVPESGWWHRVFAAGDAQQQ